MGDVRTPEGAVSKLVDTLGSVLGTLGRSEDFMGALRALNLPRTLVWIEVAKILMGKNKPTFTPGADVGDMVIIINAEKAPRQDLSPGSRSVR